MQNRNHHVFASRELDNCTRLAPGFIEVLDIQWDVVELTKCIENDGIWHGTCHAIAYGVGYRRWLVARTRQSTCRDHRGYMHSSHGWERRCETSSHPWPETYRRRLTPGLASRPTSFCVCLPQKMIFCARAPAGAPLGRQTAP